MDFGLFRRRVLPALLAGSSALLSALWIAICAGAPEFIWRGLRIALKHLNSTALLSALLIGVVLAFFVEPIMDRLRDLLRASRHKEPAHSGSRSILYSVGVSLAFALVSVSLHEAMSALVSNGDVGPTAGLALAVEWAIVPFCIAVAWQGATSQLLRVPTGILGAVSSGLTGWLFGWSPQIVIATVVPCVVIQYLGYRQIPKQPMRSAFARCGLLVAKSAIIWLLVAALLDGVLVVGGADWLRLYDLTNFLIDVRFYIGWTIGLLLVPFPTAAKS
jgi:hypothetical protein